MFEFLVINFLCELKRTKAQDFERIFWGYEALSERSALMRELSEKQTPKNPPKDKPLNKEKK